MKLIISRNKIVAPAAYTLVEVIVSAAGLALDVSGWDFPTAPLAKPGDLRSTLGQQRIAVCTVTLTSTKSRAAGCDLSRYQFGASCLPGQGPKPQLAELS